MFTQIPLDTILIGELPVSFLKFFQKKQRLRKINAMKDELTFNAKNKKKKKK